MNEETLEVAFKTVKEIDDIKKKYKNLRKGNKFTFNFFEGIARNSTYYEEYHSNFIAYLLNPSGNHECDTIFLEKFINVVNKNIKSSDDKLKGEDFKKAELYREKVLITGRKPDIAIETKDWLIFIENKIKSQERENQVRDYYEYAKKSHASYKVIYLTLDGYEPISIQEDEDKKNVICLSYKEDIINWINACIKELSRYPHITSVLYQYLDIIKKECNLLEDKEMENITEYLSNHKEDTKKLIINESYLINALNEFKTKILINEIIEPIKQIQIELAEELEENPKGNYDVNFNFREKYSVFRFYPKNWKQYYICFEFSEKDCKQLTYGISRIDENKGLNLDDILKRTSKLSYLNDKPADLWPRCAAVFVNDMELWKGILNGDFKNNIKSKVIEILKNCEGEEL